MDFLGHRIFQRRITLNRRSRARFSRKIQEIMEAWQAGVLSEPEAQARGVALCAFTRHFSDAAFRRP